jgi:uncharacterized protein YcbK (DUF882 family)
MICSKGFQVNVAPSFYSTEFDCRCNHESCNVTRIADELIGGLQELRDLLGVPIRIINGYRCAEKQRELRDRGFETAIGISQHELGRAVDLMTLCSKPGSELERIAREIGFKAVGVGHNWIHVDLRSDKVRRWEYAV